METLVWTLYFVTRKYLDYMQYYMMLLEQCEHIVAKDLAIICWARTKFLLAWSRDWTTLLPLRKTHSILHSQLCGLLSSMSLIVLDTELRKT